MDPNVQRNEPQEVAWSNFSILENLTSTAAPRLLQFARIATGTELLDVACGTGVAALTAARLGAKVTGIDLTPELVAHAKQNAELMKLEATWHTGDVEALPFSDAKFDCVVSQFGHMFGPHPDTALKEMLRVLKPGGTIAFATWPPELLLGRLFTNVGRFAPPPPPGFAPPLLWGDANVVRERLGAAVKDITFNRDAMFFQALSVQHYRVFVERNLMPVTKVFQMLDASDAPKASALRRELEELAGHYFENNTLRQDYLLTRAVKV